MALRVVFMGTPDFAVPSLRSLYVATDVVLVVSQPDRAAGRGQRRTPTPVAAAAAELEIPTFQPTTLRDADAVERLRATEADVFVVAAFGQILRAEVLALPRLGCINVHASLLPRWRGAAPIHRAVQAGDAVTGVSIMQMERGLDTGPVWSMEATPIGERETSGELHDRLAALGARLLVDTLPTIAHGEARPEAQASSRATYAPKLGPDDRIARFSVPSREAAWHVNGMNPWPGVRVFIGDDCVSLRRAIPGPDGIFAQDATPGSVRVLDDRLFLACAGGEALEVLELQRAGRRCLEASECLRGMTLPDGLVARTDA